MMPYVGRSMDRSAMRVGANSAERTRPSALERRASGRDGSPLLAVYPPLDGIPPVDTTTRSEA